jgi:large subunit ribosomal protein L32
MPNPKKRRTKSAVGKNRAHLALKKIVLAVCPKCKKAVKPHSACLNCGNYKDKKVVEIKNITNKKNK